MTLDRMCTNKQILFF
uniref:Uncharacterized protein n=1 Tax=Anguilla anguilla TaxID=7936 RepID=A0A0E9U570_ANGAN